MQFLPIQELIPQRPPFVFVDKMLAHDNESTKTKFLIRNENLFLRDGKFSETGIMENIAQTCAARIGYINLQNQQSVKIGVIGAVKNLSIYILPMVGNVLETTVTVISEVFAITLVEAKVMCGNALIATCEMKISLTEKEISE